MAPSRLTDREILEVLYDRSERAERALFGNGQPGLVETVAVNAEALRILDKESKRRAPYIDDFIALKEQVKEIGQRTPSAGQRRGVIASLIAAVLLGLASFAETFWNMRLR